MHSYANDSYILYLQYIVKVIYANICKCMPSLTVPNDSIQRGSDLLDFFTDDDWVLLGYLFSAVSFVVEGAVVFVGVPMDAAEKTIASTLKS